MHRMKSSFLAVAFGTFVCFASSALDVQGGTANMFRRVSDFDGDQRADFAVTRTENGNKIWYVWQSTDGFKVFHWGQGTDITTPGDYDGDGKTDFAVFRPSSTFPIVHRFHILESQTAIYRTRDFTAFSSALAITLNQDYNADGRTDIGLNTGEFGLITQLSVVVSGGGGFGSSIPARGFPIRIGDMDGDGRAEISHYNLDTNIVTMTNPSTQISRSIGFGISGDQYQMADFDGDGTGDLTIFRSSNGTWWSLRSSDNTVRVVQWGTAGDRPVPADYDGDGKTDPAIWRPGSQSAFWIFGSQNGVSVFPWGVSSDDPVRF